jgi:hypothetical protein
MRAAESTAETKAKITKARATGCARRIADNQCLLRGYRNRSPIRGVLSSRQYQPPSAAARPAGCRYQRLDRFAGGECYAAERGPRPAFRSRQCLDASRRPLPPYSSPAKATERWDSEISIAAVLVTTSAELRTRFVRTTRRVRRYCSLCGFVRAELFKRAVAAQRPCPSVTGGCPGDKAIHAVLCSASFIRSLMVIAQVIARQPKKMPSFTAMSH